MGISRVTIWIIGAYDKDTRFGVYIGVHLFGEIAYMAINYVVIIGVMG